MADRISFQLMKLNIHRYDWSWVHNFKYDCYRWQCSEWRTRGFSVGQKMVEVLKEEEKIICLERKRITVEWRQLVNINVSIWLIEADWPRMPWQLCKSSSVSLQSTVISSHTREHRSITAGRHWAAKRYAILIKRRTCSSKVIALPNTAHWPGTSVMVSFWHQP